MDKNIEELEQLKNEAWHFLIQSRDVEVKKIILKEFMLRAYILGQLHILEKRKSFGEDYEY